MATPLHSEELGQPKSMQFAHFGVLDAGHQSKPSVFASMFLNLFVALILIVITAANAKMIEKTNLLANVTFQPVPEKVEPVKPKFVPPPPKPILQIVPKVEVQLPRITVVKLPDVPKPPVVKMDEPKPVIAPPAPAKVIVMAAPQVVNLNAKPQAASVVNNDPHPSAVRLGNPNSPVGNMKGPGVASVNLARGMPGMNSANTGNGPPATKIILGNGSPGGTSIKGNSVVAVVGIPHGVPGATGTSQVASQVNLGQVVPPPMPKPAAPVAVVQRTEPKVLYKPKPEYTAEARQLHIEGVITLHIRVLQNGSVVVLNVINDLGHGLADSAKRAILATKFDPATDTSGQPIVWDGIVNVTFQLAG